jgi:hypothetical protein
MRRKKNTSGVLTNLFISTIKLFILVTITITAIILLSSCKTPSIMVTEVGKCVDIDEKYAYFEIYYDCKMVYPCTKTAYKTNNGKYKVGKSYKLTQIKN